MTNCQFLRRIAWMGFLFATTTLLVPREARAQVSTSGYNVNLCVLNTVDATNDVEETVCTTGDSGIVGYTSPQSPSIDTWVSVDTWGSGQYVVALGSEVVVGDVMDSGFQYDYYSDVSGDVSIDTAYTSEGYYGECYDSTGNYGANGCSWIGPTDSGLSVQVTLLNPNLTPTTLTVTDSCGNNVADGETILASCNRYVTLSGTVYVTNENPGYTVPPLSGGVEIASASGSATYYRWNGFPNSSGIASTGQISLSSGTYTLFAGYTGDNSGSGGETNEPTACLTYPNSCTTITFTVP